LNWRSREELAAEEPRTSNPLHWQNEYHCLPELARYSGAEPNLTLVKRARHQRPNQKKPCCWRGGGFGFLGCGFGGGMSVDAVVAVAASAVGASSGPVRTESSKFDS